MVPSVPILSSWESPFCFESEGWLRNAEVEIELATMDVSLPSLRAEYLMEGICRALAGAFLLNVCRGLAPRL